MVVPTQQFLRLPQVQAIIPLAKSTLYGKIKEGSFPAPVKIGARAVAWDRAAIEKYINGIQGE